MWHRRKHGDVDNGVARSLKGSNCFGITSAGLRRKKIWSCEYNPASGRHNGISVHCGGIGANWRRTEKDTKILEVVEEMLRSRKSWEAVSEWIPSGLTRRGSCNCMLCLLNFYLNLYLKIAERSAKALKKYTHKINNACIIETVRRMSGLRYTTTDKKVWAVLWPVEDELICNIYIIDFIDIRFFTSHY